MNAEAMVIWSQHLYQRQAIRKAAEAIEAIEDLTFEDFEQEGQT